MSVTFSKLVWLRGGTAWSALLTSRQVTHKWLR